MQYSTYQYKGTSKPYSLYQYISCCFSHSAYWLPTRKKLLSTVANPARGLLNREKKRERKEKVKQHTPLTPHTARSENKNKNKSGDAYTGATQVSVGRASVQGFLRLANSVKGCCFAKFYASVCDSKFPSLVASLFSWRCLATSTININSTIVVSVGEEGHTSIGSWGYGYCTGRGSNSRYSSYLEAY